ncbi:MAG: hypothetical protein A2Y00_04035 [Omnitrophica WOR_2 bacterium GWF2_43_52]|nr:MAG: hypothetical protein A2062_01905 [Omnitrophica WOR_2 bacterium GWA2_44_7]OGX15040.1 MAG: hypothetical protein A2Y01_02305 [Omnitrophica WOR_2 bacterium GWC2_44_8]OGX22598.1 MAG: hypothetical protein A2Y00_04035 [Omnitrophica WOR_2 bacterium GWF2_43_52]
MDENTLTMRFAEPYFLYSIAAAGILIGFYGWSFIRRRRILRKVADPRLLPELMVSVDVAKQKLKAGVLMVGILFCFCALLRPQWGFHWEELKRKGLDIVVAVDTSKSMLAEDIKPNRLERTKLALRDFTKNLRGDRIGLIAFAGSAFLQCPLTYDYGGFLLSLDSLDVTTIPQGGTSLSSALREALRSYEGGQKKHKVLVIITDGEDHEGDPLKVVEEAKKEGITVFCIGIGTREGELISITTESGQKEFLKDRVGNVVKSRLDEVTLQKIALMTMGSYVRSTSAEFGLELLYKEKFSKMEKREIKGAMNKQYEERFQIPLAFALLFFLVEPFISDTKKT